MRRNLVGFFLPLLIVSTVIVLFVSFGPTAGEEESRLMLLSGDYSTLVFTTLFFVMICAVVQIMLGVSKRKRGTKMADFIDAERRANFSRRRDLPEPIQAIFPQEACLGDASSYNGLEAKQERARLCSQQPMLKLYMNNTEIKHSFGPQNLEKISAYEENFNRYVVALLDWAEVLLHNGMKDRAVMVLEEAVRIGADTSRAYIMLAQLYHEAGSRSALQALSTMIEARSFGSLDGILKSKIYEHINARMETL